jgi:hypothetical protein
VVAEALRRPDRGLRKEKLVTDLGDIYEDVTLTPEEWQRRQAAAIRVISQYVTDRDQRLEMLEMLGLLPLATERVA